jgi:8-oxo-dGTP diphosphatase
MSYTYEYPRPMLCVDIAIITTDTKEILLIKRKNEPFQGSWALPGGFMDKEEALDKAAYRELEEETSVRNIELHRFKVYDEPKRDPRGRTISMVYIGTEWKTKIIAKAGDDAVDVAFFSLKELPNLAFDHKKIVQEIINNNTNE